MLISIFPAGANVTITSHVDLGPLDPGFELLVESSVIGEAAPAPFGRYKLAVEVAGTAVVSSTEFERVERARNPQVRFPTAGIPVRVDAAPSDGPWPVSTGVPLPLGAVADASELALFDAAGARIPAQFTPLADWYKPLGAHRSIKWVALDFVAQCRKNAVQEYRVRTGGAHQPAANWVADTDDIVTVDTGLIRFTMNKKHGFNGIDKLERWTGSDWRVIAQYGAGPYLEVRAKGDSQRTAVRRIRFTAAEDSHVDVKVIEEKAAGSECVTIRAEGYYYCASAGQEWEDPGGPVDSDDERKHCRFVIDVRAHRGTAQLDIASTLILLTTRAIVARISRPPSRTNTSCRRRNASTGSARRTPLGWDSGGSNRSTSAGTGDSRLRSSAAFWDTTPATDPTSGRRSRGAIRAYRSTSSLPIVVPS